VSVSDVELSHLLAVLPLQVKIIGWIHASVHALLVSGDSALHSHPLRCRSQRKLLQVVNVDGRFTDWWSGCGSHLLRERTAHWYLVIDALNLTFVKTLKQHNEAEDQLVHWDYE